MKKLITLLTALGLGTMLGVAQVNVHGPKNFTGEVNLDGGLKIDNTVVTATAAEINQLDGNAFDVISVSGKSTLNGELEVNNSDVDINMTLTANKVTIDQTNAAGTASTPLIKMTDARTGATADQATEATLHITAAGGYGLTVADGIVQIEGEIDTASNDITLDPAGGNVIVDGAVDADSYTVNAGEGLDTKTAGELTVGAATATSISVGDSGTTVAIASSDWSIDATGLIGNCSLTADQITGNMAVARITNALIDAIGPDEMEDADHGDVSWASGVATVDEVAGANISGNIAIARLTNAMPTMAEYAVNDLGNGTNLPTSGLVIEADVKAVLDAANNAAIRTAIDVPANSAVFGSADITIGAIAAAQRITTNTIAMLDTGGNAKASEALIEVWTSETAFGLASTNNIEALVLSGGSAVRTVLANGDYMYVTSTGGAATATITGTAAGTNYLNVSVGANVASEAIVLTD